MGQRAGEEGRRRRGCGGWGNEGVRRGEGRVGGKGRGKGRRQERRHGEK